MKATPEGLKAYLEKIHADTKMSDGTIPKAGPTAINGH